MPPVIQCPKCNRSITVNQSHVGRLIKCPHCHHPFTVPGSVPTPLADPFAGLPIPEPDLSEETRRTVGTQGYETSGRGYRGSGRGGWPGDPPGWLVAARIIIWGLIAFPSLLLLMLQVAALFGGIATSDSGFGRVARASDVVIAVGVAFALDRLLSANRY